MTEYTLFIRNEATNTLVKQIETFNQFEVTMCFNRVGKFTLDLGRLDDDIIHGNGVVLRADNVAIFSGPITKVVENLSKVTAYGADDMIYLSDRLASPVPAGPPYTSQAYDVRTGAAETVLKQYADNNAGPSAPIARRIPGLTIEADAGTGTAVTGRARFDPLLDLLRFLALSGGDLGFRVVGKQFQVFTPANKTSTVKFSKELGNLADYEYSADRPKANYLIVGGDGSGTARTFVEGGDTSSMITHGKIEKFVDLRSTSVVSELNQKVATELDANTAKISLKLTPIELPRMKFLTDWNLGDNVTAVIKGVPLISVVREVAIKMSNTGVRIEPLIGTYGVRSGLFQTNEDKLENLDKAVKLLERE